MSISIWKESEPETCFYGKVRRACDCCRARKVRCDGRQPCSRCLLRSSECTFRIAPRKKGPRRDRSDELKLKVKNPRRSSSADCEQQASPHSYASTTVESELSAAFNDEAQGEDDGDVALTSPNDYEADCPPDIDKSGICPIVLPGVSSVDAAISMLLGPRQEDSYNGPHSSLLSASLPPRVFLPLIKVFFDHLFPIMPVLDRNAYLNSDRLRSDAPLPSREYSMLAAACALTAVQLNLPASFIQQDLPSLSPELLVEECLRERRQCDYIEDPDTSTVLTSFFLFGYYGNLERHNKARHYLHEAISFAESVGLDNEVFLSQLPLQNRQQYRIVFWLLFVTERAYALQRGNHAKILTPSIEPPAIFESEDPRLLYGFVSLVNVFLVIDSTFLSAWDRTSIRDSFSKAWLIEMLRKLEASAITLPESLEKHQLDVSISKQWLQILLWKISAKRGLLTLSSTDEPLSLQYPLQIARDVVTTTSVVSQASLDSHGIGMEQKIADIASCLADVLICTHSDVSEPVRQGRESLMALLLQLSRMRGGQSHYLQPLLEKANIPTYQMLSPISSSCESRPVEEDTATGFEAVQDLDGQDYNQWFPVAGSNGE